MSPYDHKKTTKPMLEVVALRADGERPIAIDERGYKAYQLRLAGKDWETVAKETGYKDGYVAQVDVRKYIQRAAMIVDQTNKLEVIGIELDRLDSLQEAVWDDAMGGDTKAVDSVLRVMGHRAKLLGLDIVAQSGTALTSRTIVIQGTAEEYIKALVQSDA